MIYGRWATCLMLAIVLGLCAVLLPLPGAVGTIVYVGAVLAAIGFLVFLILDVFLRRGRSGRQPTP